LAASLWLLGAWAATAEALPAQLTRTEAPADRFTALAAAVRHLLADPVLPSDSRRSTAGPRTAGRLHDVPA
jgi:phenylacetic acid degradation operon negative regulatory protein